MRRLWRMIGGYHPPARGLQLIKHEGERERELKVSFITPPPSPPPTGHDSLPSKTPLNFGISTVLILDRTKTLMNQQRRGQSLGLHSSPLPFLPPPITLSRHSPCCLSPNCCRVFDGCVHILIKWFAAPAGRAVALWKDNGVHCDGCPCDNNEGETERKEVERREVWADLGRGAEVWKAKGEERDSGPPTQPLEKKSILKTLV